jgi:hypothetical protein
MRFFPLQDYRDWLLGLFLGIVLAILIYLAFRATAESTRGAGKERGGVTRYPDAIEGGHNPPPLLIIFLLVGFAVWILFYVIYVGVYGGPI